MEKKNDEDSESVKAEKTAGDGETKQSNRVKLSPHSHNVNVSEAAKKMAVVDPDKRLSVKLLI